MKTFSSPAKICLSGLLLLFLTMGCKLLNPGNSGSSNAPSNANNSRSASGNPRQDLVDAFRKLNNAYPYRLTETSSASVNKQSAVQSTRVVEFEAADRVHAKISSGTGGPIESVTLGDKKYLKLGSAWTEGEGRSAAANQDMTAKMEKLMESATKEVQAAGSETVNGTPCYVYTYRFDMDLGGKTYSGTGKTWVGESDGLPHQVDGEYNSSNYRWSHHIVYEYRVNIKIAKPM